MIVKMIWRRASDRGTHLACRSLAKVETCNFFDKDMHSNFVTIYYLQCLVMTAVYYVVLFVHVDNEGRNLHQIWGVGGPCQAR
jgi:hypothetical protein